ncbi:hypothetical protein FOA52_001068 [Chlamydomonas sp. UWO 241]|nr:hypothetical protein FOA52_001068 [Chlamydomonas sp. UWO 241]
MLCVIGELARRSRSLLLRGVIVNVERTCSTRGKEPSIAEQESHAARPMQHAMQHEGVSGPAAPAATAATTSGSSSSSNSGSMTKSASKAFSLADVMVEQHVHLSTSTSARDDPEDAPSSSSSSGGTASMYEEMPFSFSLADAMLQREAAFAALADATAASMIRRPGVTQSIKESMKLNKLVRAYQIAGHYAADLDPLGLQQRPPPPKLDPRYYGFTEEDMDREFFVGTWSEKGFLAETNPILTLRSLHATLRATYCGRTGYEYMHIPDPLKRTWIQQRIELLEPPRFTQQEKLLILNRLCWSEMFETFLSAKFPATKRFGLEGGETLIPGMIHLIDVAAELGVEAVVMGMPHRGRLNVLANVVRKPLPQIFCEFSGRPVPSAVEDDEQFIGSGDVKYHLGTSCQRPTASGRMVHISLMANPSHLEAINPVVLGKTRAKQHFADDHSRTRTLSVLLHGDGAFSGEGVVYETLDMSGLKNYTVGGTVHFVLNNQVAFTTDPREERSSPYCTDVAKSMNAPIFHVNGDDVEAVTRACGLAIEWRQTFGTDVVIDVVCYRKYGHNETDEPSFTQPLMYKKIRGHPNPHQMYMAQLLAEGSVSQVQIDAVTDRVRDALEQAWAHATSYRLPADDLDWLSNNWQGFNTPVQHSPVRNTGVPLEALKALGDAMTLLPRDKVTPHKAITQMYAMRRNAIATGEGIDWATAEALAFATLLSEGNHVRLSGQDVERGTFNHRHSVVHDQLTGKRYTPLDHLYPGQDPRQFTVCNSSLSEFGVLGFELGYSLENPDSLVLWEAQFGDFANCGQVIFDQFLSSGESKWLRQTGLVALLPHGYDGQGPEHSSARIERFLQMCDDDPYNIPEVNEADWFHGRHLGSQIQSGNWQIVNCTTPANYFHVLRRQVHRQFRKPLIVFSPKNLLRHAKCRSRLADFADVPLDEGIVGARFKRLITDDTGVTPKLRAPHPPTEPDCQRLILCTGKVFYNLHARRAAARLDNGRIAVVRLEQLAPFPHDLVCRELRRYPNADVVWCQEEPMNMGAYHHVQPRLVTCLEHEGRSAPGGHIPYAGREPSAASATGFAEVYKEEQNDLIASALNLGDSLLRRAKPRRRATIWHQPLVYEY